MGQRGADQFLDRRVVGDLIVHDDAAVAVRRVLAQAHVGDDQEVGHLALQRADGALHRSLRIVGRRASGVLRIGQPEEEDAGDAVGLRGRRLLDGLVDRNWKTPGIDAISCRWPSPLRTKSG